MASWRSALTIPGRLFLLGSTGVLMYHFPHQEVVLIWEPWECHLSVWLLIFILYTALQGVRLLRTIRQWGNQWQQRWQSHQQAKVEQARQRTTASALVAYLEGRFDDAYPLLVKLTQQNPGSSAALYGLLAAQAAHATGKRQIRDQWLHQIRMVIPMAADGLDYLQAEFALHDHDLPRAIPLLESLLAQRPQDTRVAQQLLTVYEKQGEGAKILQIMTGAASPALQQLLGKPVFEALENKAATWLSQSQGATTYPTPHMPDPTIALLPRRLREDPHWMGVHFPHAPCVPKRWRPKWLSRFSRQHTPSSP